MRRTTILLVLIGAIATSLDAQPTGRPGLQISGAGSGTVKKVLGSGNTVISENATGDTVTVDAALAGGSAGGMTQGLLKVYQTTPQHALHIRRAAGDTTRTGLVNIYGSIIIDTLIVGNDTLIVSGGVIPDNFTEAKVVDTSAFARKAAANTFTAGQTFDVASDIKNQSSHPVGNPASGYVYLYSVGDSVWTKTSTGATINLSRNTGTGGGTGTADSTYIEVSLDSLRALLGTTIYVMSKMEFTDSLTMNGNLLYDRSGTPYAYSDTNVTQAKVESVLVAWGLVKTGTRGVPTIRVDSSVVLSVTRWNNESSKIGHTHVLSDITDYSPSGGGGSGDVSFKDDAFTTTATRDTVSWTGAHSYDSYTATPVLTAPTDSTADVLGVYPDTGRVIVTRKYGGTSGQAYTLHRVAGTLAPPTSLNVTTSTSTSLALTWTAPAASASVTTRPIDSVAIVYSTSAYRTSTTGAGDSVKVVSKTSTSDSLTGLTASTKYYVSMFSRTTRGEYSADTSAAHDTCTTIAGGTTFAYVGSKLDSTTSPASLDSISYTVGTGSGRYLVMSSYWRENSDYYDSRLDSVVWVVSSTRQNFSWVDSVSANNGNWSNRRMETWVLANPTSGAGNMIYYLNSGHTASSFQTTITEFEGANTALRDTGHTRANYDASVDFTLTSENGDIAVGFFAQFETSTTMAVVDGETRRQGNYIRNILVTEPATTTSTTLSLTLGTADVWIFSGVVLRPN